MINDTITYAKQWIDDEDIKAVTDVLRSDILTQGPAIEHFEKTLATKVGAKYAVAVSNGTAALHIAYLAAGLKPKERVITSPITFAATANAALYADGKPIFADILPNLPLIDPKKINTKITSNTKIIAPVHYGGMVCNMAEIKEIAEKNNLYVIEDACHALGSKFNGEPVGSCKYSHMTIFSFHPVKHITTGEGGAITTNDETLYKKLLLLRSHGITKDNFVNPPDSPRYYEMTDLGYNYRITDIQAALGISQLNKLDLFIKKRREIARCYCEHFSQLAGITLMDEPPTSFNSYHLFPVLFKNADIREKIFRTLYKLGIQTQIHYIPVYRHPYYRANGYKNINLPNANKFYSRVLSLPMYPKMTEENIMAVIGGMKKALQDVG